MGKLTLGLPLAAICQMLDLCTELLANRMSTIDDLINPVINFNILTISQFEGALALGRGAHIVVTVVALLEKYVVALLPTDTRF